MFQSNDVSGAENSLSWEIINLNEIGITFTRLRCREHLLSSVIFQILSVSPEVAKISWFSLFECGINISFVGGY